MTARRQMLDCNNPSVTADGRYVAFDSSASNLVPGDTNGRIDIFVYDREYRHDRASKRCK